MLPSQGMLQAMKHLPKIGKSPSAATPASADGRGHTSAGTPKFSIASRYTGGSCWFIIEDRKMGMVCTGMPMRFGKPAMSSVGTSSSKQTMRSASVFLPPMLRSASKVSAIMSMVCFMMISYRRCPALSCTPRMPSSWRSINCGSVR